MVEPGIWPDILNKFSQLTPWVQAVAIISACLTVLGTAYFFKETIRIVSLAAIRDRAPR